MKEKETWEETNYAGMVYSLNHDQEDIGEWGHEAWDIAMQYACSIKHLPRRPTQFNCW